MIPRKGFVQVWAAPVDTFVGLRTKSESRSEEVQEVVGEPLLISLSERRAGIGQGKGA